jgi:hypothetical protein
VSVEAARRHLERLASVPRPAGSAAEAAARAYCAKELEKAGFRVSEEPFEYSALPGRWGTPALGVLGGLMLTAAGHVGNRGDAALAVLILAAGSIVMGIAARWLGRYGVTRLRAMRSQSANLVAVRGTPHLWLIAHLDSKSQPIPIIVRAIAIMGLLASIAAGIVVALVQWLGSDVGDAWIVITGIGVLCALPVAASIVRSSSPGALDDASGVATVLLVAESLPQQLALGVVLTSAEELGLAGARSWVGARSGSHAVNLDGIDDHGDVRLTWTGKCPRDLIERIRVYADQQGARVRSGRLLPGVLLDGVAFADAGWEVVTISRGTLRTVSRIHTARDSLRGISGKGVAQIATVLRSMITSGA